MELKDAKKIDKKIEQEKNNYLINTSNYSVFYNGNTPYECEVICTCNHEVQKLSSKKNTRAYFQNEDNYSITGNQYASYTCPYCNTRYDTEFVPNLLEIKSNKYGNKPIKSEKIKSIINVKKHPENDCGIIIQLIDITLELCEKDGKYDVDYVYTVKVCAEIIPGVVSKTYRVNKTKLTECDPFDGFNINKDTVNDDSNRRIYFENAVNPLEFLINNEDFAKKSGVLDAYKYNDKVRPINSFFLNYMCLIMSYPVIELLIKMGHYRMYNSIMESIYNSYSKKEISDKIKRLNKLLNDTTKGSLALRIPQYIGDYLKTTSASLNEFLMWSDIYEFEQLSKENFYEVINSYEYLYCKNTYPLNNISNVLKYGYKFNQLLKYIVKQDMIINKETHRTDVINIMFDYLEMCELLEIKPDKYPKDIVTVHNRCQKLISDNHISLYDKKIAEIGKTVEEAIYKYVDEDKLSKMHKEYVIILPKSSKDFIEEGQMQHNCVASYANRVYNNKCIIFFVRKKSDPTQSFITAECSEKGILQQCMYKNNKRVDDDDLINFCKVTCNRIKNGYIKKD